MQRVSRRSAALAAALIKGIRSKSGHENPVRIGKKVRITKEVRIGKRVRICGTYWHEEQPSARPQCDMAKSEIGRDRILLPDAR